MNKDDIVSLIFIWALAGSALALPTPEGSEWLDWVLVILGIIGTIGCLIPSDFDKK